MAAPPDGLYVCPQISSRIADHLEEEDIPAFRLAGKEFCISATPAFIRHFFTEITVFWSRESLRTLVEVCRHDVFGKHIKQITFASQVLDELNSISDYFSSANTEAELELFRLDYTCAKLEQSQMINSKEGIQLLSYALTYLNIYGNPITLGMRDTVGDREVPGSVLQRSKFMSRIHFNTWQTDRKSTSKALFDAAAKSQCNIDSLSINFEAGVASYPADSMYYINGADLTPSTRRNPNAKALCANIKSLTMAMHYPKPYDTTGLPLCLTSKNLWVDDYNSFAPFLIQSCPLQNLSLTLDLDKTDMSKDPAFDEYNISLVCTEAIRAKPGMLTSLRLDGFFIDEGSLRDAPKAIKSTLRIFELHDCTLVTYDGGPQGCWSRLLRCWKGVLKLDSLSLGDLWVEYAGRDRAFSVYAKVFTGAKRFKGGRVREGFEEVVSEVDEAEGKIVMRY